MGPAVALTEDGLAAALKLEAEGVDVRALVSAELLYQATVGGALATYARQKGISVRTFVHEDFGDALIVVTDGRGGAWSSPKPRVLLTFRRNLNVFGPVSVAASLINNGDEYDKTVHAIPDDATTPEAWIAFGESLVAEKVAAKYVEMGKHIADVARKNCASAMLGN